MRIVRAFLMMAAIVATAGNMPAQEWDFEDATAGKVPDGWSTTKTGTGPGSVWKVIEDKTAPKGPKVLAQVSSEGPKPLFNLCVADKTSYKDLDLSVSVQGVKGRIDQGGGPVWRYQGKDNYYVARINPLEWNYRLYKVVDGKRIHLASADVELAEDDPRIDEDDALLKRWHSIRVVHKGSRIRCYLNGKLLLEAEDTSIETAGKAGFWTKADAVTGFDAFSVAAVEK